MPVVRNGTAGVLSEERDHGGGPSPTVPSPRSRPIEKKGSSREAARETDYRSSRTAIWSPPVKTRSAVFGIETGCIGSLPPSWRPFGYDRPDQFHIPVNFLGVPWDRDIFDPSRGFDPPSKFRFLILASKPRSRYPDSPQADARPSKSQKSVAKALPRSIVVMNPASSPEKKRACAQNESARAFSALSSAEPTNSCAASKSAK